MKIKLIHWKYYKTKSKTFPVKIRVSHNNKTDYIDLDIHVSEKQWTGTRVKDHPHASEYNMKIIDAMAKAEKNAIIDGSVSVGNRKALNWWFEDYIKLCELKHSEYHTRKIKNVFVKIKRFRSDILAIQINNKLIRDFETFLLKQDLHVNYISDVLSRLKHVVSLMVKDGVIEYHKNPFNDYKLKYVKTDKDRLSFPDIQKLEKVKLDGDERLARDIYIVSFYAGGVRFGDCCRLNKDNFEDGRLKYTMNKTTVSKNIKLPAHIYKLMEGYNFRFPTKVDWKKEDKSIASRRTVLAKKLKSACKKAGVKQISFHTSRNSIADFAIKNKLSDQQLQGILGHKLNSTTQIYKKSFYQEETDEAIDKLWE